DEAQREKGSSRVPLNLFLKKLLGKEVLDFLPNASPPGKKPMKLRGAFKNAYIHFTHAVIVQKQDILTKETMWLLMARGALPICATGQKGVDLIIPVVQGDIVKESTVTAIFIQVKNDDPTGPDCSKYFLNLHPKNTNYLSQGQEALELPFIRLVMAFQGKKNEVTRHFIDYSRPVDFTAYDIICRGITPETYKVIKQGDVEGWKRCLDILGGFEALFKHPNGEEMSDDQKRTTRFRWPGADHTEKFPFRWMLQKNDSEPSPA
ncbi:4151_t:CDS:1, partial [Acaulospora colombiana]